MSLTTMPTAAGLVGNVTDDPVLRFSATGKAWATFRLAVKPYLAGAGEQPEPVYYSVVCFGSLAENVCKAFSRGTRVVVSGRLEEDSWTGRDGVERVGMKLIADAAGKDLRFAEQSGTSRPGHIRTAASSQDADGLVPAPNCYEDEPF
jgi:single-strand DNA-binding protein